VAVTPDDLAGGVLAPDGTDVVEAVLGDAVGCPDEQDVKVKVKTDIPMTRPHVPRVTAGRILGPGALNL
jgi:hypothetical protein